MDVTLRCVDVYMNVCLGMQIFVSKLSSYYVYALQFWHVSISPQLLPHNNC